MITIKAEYADLRFLILELIFRAKGLMRPEIFRHIRNLPTDRYSFVGITAEMINEAFESLTEEELLHELCVDRDHAPKYMLTSAGLQELIHDERHLGGKLDGLHAIRKIFPKSAVVSGKDMP